MLEAKELMVFYENMLALNNVSITAETGSVIGIFGSNSAGKSTLMYTLSGIMPVSYTHLTLPTKRIV